MRNDYGIRPRNKMKKGGKAFPDLNIDGKVTRADILKGRGVFKKGGKAKKGFPDLNKDGKITYADVITARMSKGKKGKMMKGKR